MHLYLVEMTYCRQNVQFCKEFLGVFLDLLLLQVHLSDSYGMPIFVDWVKKVVSDMVVLPTSEPSSPPSTFCRPLSPRSSPKVVVKGETVVRQQRNPYEWSVVGQGVKVMICAM